MWSSITRPQSNAYHGSNSAIQSITIDGWWDLQYVVHVTLVEQGKPLSKWSNAYVPPVFKDLIQDGHVFLCTEQKNNQ